MSAGGHAAELPGGGRALFTTAGEGNMSSVGGAGAELGAANRERLRERLGLSALARGHQVHGAVVVRVRTAPADRSGGEARVRADGQATALPRLGAMVLSADCMPVALGADGAVAMVHAGWRGLAAGVLEEGVAAVRELAGAGRIEAVIGPCAGGCCYEVGPEVHAALGSGARGRARIDLREIAHRRLLAAGVQRVDDVPACTICAGGLFSHRREGAAAGRMAAVAWLS